jgi:L-fucose isomerase-like protein
MKALASEMQLDALSLNCWPHLKARICLPISRLNDEGIGSGCEGDLHSTILMQALYSLSGRAAINGDFLRMYEEGQDNDVLFSHCGAGPMSMARSSSDIILQESIETHDGLGIFFPADQPGTVTALNLMGSRAGYRLSAMVGVVQPTDLTYEGTPMRLRFEIPVRTILQSAVDAGAGHHWSLAYGDFAREFALLCRWLGIEFHLLSQDG